MRSRCRLHVVTALERTQQTSLLHLRPQPLGRWSCAPPRCYATCSATAEHSSKQSRSLSVSSDARYNEVGVQHVSQHIHKQLFPIANAMPQECDQDLVALSKRHLARHELLGKTGDQVAPIGFDLPDLQGASLDEHFYRLGMDSSEPYLNLAKKYARAAPPPKPRKWAQRSGWTKYHEDGTWEALDAPDAEVLTFDIEVMWRETNFPAMACAVSDKYWYAWLSPWLLGESENDRHLIPLGDPQKNRIIVGHNIGYDRARIAEEYDLRQSRNFYMDTMSLHVAVNGMCSRQRPGWNKARKARETRDKIANEHNEDELSSTLSGGVEMEDEEEMWVGRSSANSLRDVAKFHCNITIDKARREWFGELDRDGICERLDELLDYCAADVDVTHKVYKKVFPLFLETCPHPVSFAALRHLASEILPVNKTWESYIANADATYHRLSSAVNDRLVALARKALELKDQIEVWESDPWLSQLDWAGQEIRMVKGKKKGDPPRPSSRQKMPGMPNWYRELFPRKDADIQLTVRTRIAPLLLRLAWDGHPLVWTDKYGWTFRTTYDEAAKYRSAAMIECDLSEDSKYSHLQDMHHIFFKLPHAGGPTARCTSPIAKGYQQFFDNGTLASEYDYAREALDMNASCSYWISARDRIKTQMVVYDRELAGASEAAKATEQGYILPQIIPMGTITRRAVENTWLTAANAKNNRVGSELKSMIKAPPGYAFVGADVDSQELWIASLVGDASFKLHGGNAIGFMTLEGTKAAGTDLHSKTAKILGISRNDAKVFNYGRIYGAGQDFAKSLLRRFNPSLQEEEADRIAKQLYKETKGERTNRKALHERRFWRGGTESLVFNKLEDFAEQEKPRTPVLGAGITEALMRRFIGKSQFLTSRINWAIQSSGVDYLHLLILSMDYLTRRYNIHARLALTVHDEIRYLATYADKYRCAMALQVANVWTRAMFSQQVGIDDLPQSCAYFSAVDIDHVLRKEVDMDCVTPSHPDKIPPGESLDILQLLEKGAEAYLNPAVVPVQPPRPERFEHVPRVPVMESLEAGAGGQETARRYLRAQIAEDTKELNGIIREASGARTLTHALKGDDDASPRAPRKRSPPASAKKKASTSGAGTQVRNASTRPYMSEAQLREQWYAPASSASSPGTFKRRPVVRKFLAQQQEKMKTASTTGNLGVGAVRETEYWPPVFVEEGEAWAERITIVQFVSSSPSLRDVTGGSKGPWFYTSTLGTDGWIREAETTLVVPAQPANNKGYLALWLGMGTTSKDFIQGIVASNPHERDGQWNTFAYTLHPTGSATEADHVFIQVGDHVTSHYMYNDATGKYGQVSPFVEARAYATSTDLCDLVTSGQSVKVNGKLVSTISTSSGHAESCYSRLQCATDAPETCGLVPAHKWINTRIVVNQVDTEFYSSFGPRGGTTASEIYTSDGGTTWHIDEAHIPAYTFN